MSLHRYAIIVVATLAIIPAVPVPAQQDSDPGLFAAMRWR